MTIIINPLGQSRRQELGRVEEYAYFLFCGKAEPAPALDDLLNAPAGGSGGSPRWEWLLRGGTDSDRASRANMFYPIFIEPETRRIAMVGEAPPLEASRHEVEVPEGLVAVWPLRIDGAEGRWRLQPSTLRRYLEQGVAKLGAYDRTNDRWSILYLGDAMRQRMEDGDIVITARESVTGAVTVEYANATSTVAKTVWNRGTHRAGEYGSRMVSDFVGPRLFPFPKSLYAVVDALRVAVGNNPDALILDFFAGSGTTLHATAMLNQEDGGCRRSILVTNNEVNPDIARKLNADGHYRCDPEFETHGIFEAITRPRCEAAITGRRADGVAVAGTYIDGREYAAGFDENVEFFRLDYLDGDDVQLGREFPSIHPLLWLAAGARAPRPPTEVKAPYLIASDCRYAVLFDDAVFREFEERLAVAKDITHVFLVTDSKEAYAEMRGYLDPKIKTTQLYSDFILHFKKRLRP